MASCKCAAISACTAKIIILKEALKLLNLADGKLQDMDEKLVIMKENYPNTFESINNEELGTATQNINNDLYSVSKYMASKINEELVKLEEELTKLKSEDEEFHKEEEANSMPQ